MPVLGAHIGRERDSVRCQPLGRANFLHAQITAELDASNAFDSGIKLGRNRMQTYHHTHEVRHPCSTAPGATPPTGNLLTTVEVASGTDVHSVGDEHSRM